MRPHIAILLGALLLGGSTQGYAQNTTPGHKAEKASSKATSITQESALAFLYKYMPLPDSVNYNTDFFRAQVDIALRARQETPWGMRVPEREWKHFVLPVRVNNEDLDNFRVEKYEELKARVKGMTMEEAALEVNHWCHEHVSYQPSDARTSSPLATIRSAIGRCGEESTLTVAALRTVGIPARQVYTPRWAHTDDNHAWVEAWIDGEWKFMGACEPEPVLNLGWFNAPASRAMLMHTKAFGDYDGPERVMTRTACYTEIDVTDTYAPTSVFQVEVVDAKGKPAKGATVQFRLYNYAEFFPLNTKQTDKHGRCDFKAGHGTLLVWATDGKRFGFEKIQVGTTTQPLRIKLDKDASNIGQLLPQTFDIEVTPPSERNTIPPMTDEQIARNKERLAYEDSVRGAYTATFKKSGSSFIAEAFHKARGNRPVIQRHLHTVIQEIEDGDKAKQQFRLLSEKDFRDVTLEVLHDNFTLAPDTLPYIFSQRISNELLTPYRSEFLRLISKDEQEAFRQNPSLLAERIEREFALDEATNSQQLCMHPAKAWLTKHCDRHSRDIMFVAILRTLGVEARIDEVTGKVQYRVRKTANQQGSERDWTTVFEEKKATSAKQGMLHLVYEPNAVLTDPRYNNHFTLSKLENGVPVLLNYPECEVFSKIFNEPTALDEGTYLLTTGTRLANGGVLSRMTFFQVKADEKKQLSLTFRSSTDEVQVIGNFGSETRYTPAFIFDNKEVSVAGMPSANFPSVDLLPENSILSTTGRGYYVIGLLSVGSEPTNHALSDLSAAKSELEAWGRPILLIANDKEELTSIKKNFPNLPSTVHFGLDSTGKIKEGMQTAVQGEPITNWPVFLMADTFDRVIFLRQGYTIGLGDQLVKIAKKL